MHLPSQGEFVLPYVAFLGYVLEKEEEGEFELELGGGGEGDAIVRTSGYQAQNDLLSLPSWSSFQIQPPKNGPIQLLPLLPEREPQVLLGEGFLAQPADALILDDDERHVQQIRPR